MKKTHKLENGTVLEVGKRYTQPFRETGHFYLIIGIGEHSFFWVNQAELEGFDTLEGLDNFIPYTKPIEQDLKEHKPYFSKYSDGSIGFVGFFKKRVNSSHMTAEELEARGLNLSMFNQPKG